MVVIRTTDEYIHIHQIFLFKKNLPLFLLLFSAIYMYIQRHAQYSYMIQTHPSMISRYQRTFFSININHLDRKPIVKLESS